MNAKSLLTTREPGLLSEECVGPFSEQQEEWSEGEQAKCNVNMEREGTTSCKYSVPQHGYSEATSCGMAICTSEGKPCQAKRTGNTLAAHLQRTGCGNTTHCMEITQGKDNAA